MKKQGIIISSEVLKNMLKELNKVKTPKSSPLEAQQILVRSDKDTGIVSFTKTDMKDFAVKQPSKMVETNFSGQFMLTEEVYKLVTKIKKEQPLSISFENVNTVTISGENFKATISPENPIDFPEMPDEKSFVHNHLSVSYDELAKIYPFLGNDELKMSMTGFFFDHENQSIAGTDGHRLRAIKTSDIDQSFILRGSVFKYLDKKKNYSVSTSDKFVRLQSGEDTIYSEIIDEKYPQWKNVIPSDYATITTVTKESISEAIDQGLIFANKTTHQIILNFNGKATLKAIDLDNGSDFDIEMESKEKIGDDIEIGFNGKYLQECIKYIDGDLVTFNLNESNRAAVLGDSQDDILLIMPVMIKPYLS